MNNKRLWWWLAAVTAVSFVILGGMGRQIYVEAPPVPERVVTTTGDVIFSGDDIREGQNVWQSMGGQQVGSVWGHGSYVAPDWSADWLHREAAHILNTWSQRMGGRVYDDLPDTTKAGLLVSMQKEIRTNTYEPKTGTIDVSPDRADAIVTVARHYQQLFGDAPEQAALRSAYAIRENSVRTPERLHQLSAFLFWTAWACGTNRPGDVVTYTSNWPAEPLIGNTPPPSLLVWSVLSFVLLLAGIGALAWYFAVERAKSEADFPVPKADPLLALNPTPSMKATQKYFWAVTALLLVQIGLGAITAHYGVEGTGFYGFPLSNWLPYSVTRTWHTQLGIFWIATAWLATGLFMAPAIAGREPKFQRSLVNLLFGCLILIIVGSMIGELLGIHQRLGNITNFWFGHQGYEYVDLGRFWQIFLAAGLFIWLGLMLRGMWPALKERTEDRSLLGLLLVSTAAIALFYLAGLMWGQHTNLAIAEYWRWWVVHLWVEGFFEVFATTIIAFLLTRMRLVRIQSATSAVLFSTIIFLTGGIVGTFHHLYFTGTPIPVIALGATFSALEVVPLVLIGFEAYQNLSLTRSSEWVTAYKWPIYFFVAVGFWNLVGAGLFGFLINPPIALYYMQGLNTTPVHAHTALFGVYGMLGIGLMLFCLKGLAARTVWKEGVIRFAFWAMNAGLAAMVLLSVLPVGLLQAWASVEHGMWYARSAEFMQSPLMDSLRWLRFVGDTTFALGGVALAWFVAGLKFGWSVTRQEDKAMKALSEHPEPQRNPV